MGNMAFYLDGRELPRDVPYNEPDQEMSLESSCINKDEKISSNIILTSNANDVEREMDSSVHSIPKLAHANDDKDIVCDVPYKEINRMETIRANRKKIEAENETSTFKVSQEVIDEDREMCLFNHSTSRLVYVNDEPEVHFIFNGEEFESLEDLFDAKDKYGELMDKLLEEDEQDENFAAGANVRLPNINIAEQLISNDVSGLSVMVAYIISGLRQLGGKVTFGEERIDNAEYQFATKLVKELDASKLNILISHIVLGLNQIGGEVNFGDDK